MSDMPESVSTILIAGASRGLGQAMAAEFLKRGWRVIGTVRDVTAHTALHDLLSGAHGRLEIEVLDINADTQIAALRERLAGRRLDVLFVNAGTTTPNQLALVNEVPDEEFMRVMATNALRPLRVIDALQDLVPRTGLIGAMSSGQGSIANNMKGGHEVYRGSKAALNQYMRSYAARHADNRRPLVLMAPGWIRTELGGPKAMFSVEETIPDLVDTLLAQQGTSGLRFIDRHGQTVPW
jgi:NAD(P)-dependent dehydrogenase (short-subunit alcohol dehydrogenase family)